MFPLTGGMPRTIAQGGWIGWFGEPDENPVMDVIESSPPTFSFTCTTWYDEHVSFEWPALARMAPGPFRATAKVRVRWVDKAQGEAMLKDAVWFSGEPSRTMSPFVQGVVNDCEEPMRPGVLLVADKWNLGGAGSWDRAVGRSGHSSLRLEGRGAQGKASLMPGGGGPSLHLDEDSRYRWAAWVRTEGADGGAYLRARKIYMNPGSTDTMKESARIKGTQDWTRLEVVFDTTDKTQFVWPYLCLDGAGRAWFDDIELTCLGPAGAAEARQQQPARQD